MFAGYLAFGGTVLIDNHRTQQWAAQLGLHWLRGCTQCSGLVPRDRTYVTPLKDAVKPPWWNGSADARSFLGLYGITVDGADGSTREIDTVEGIADGGYMGAKRNRMRTLTVRALAVAESDCALGFGLEWLDSIDSSVCTRSTVRMYECCPCVCGPGCDDPTCQQSCVARYQREFRNCRITSGPTVLSRRTMPSGGAVAQVEFQIVATDPKRYTSSTPWVFDTAIAVPVSDPAVVLDPRTANPWSTPVEPHPPGRVDWLRSEHATPLPDGFVGTMVAPDVMVVAQSGPVDDVRVTLRDASGVSVASYLIPTVPDGASVRVDFGDRLTYAEWGGMEQVRLGLVTGPLGGPIMWPQDLPVSDYTVVVDRPPATPPLVVSVTMNGASR